MSLGCVAEKVALHWQAGRARGVVLAWDQLARSSKQTEIPSLVICPYGKFQITERL